MLGRNRCRNHNWSSWYPYDHHNEDNRHCLNRGCDIAQALCLSTGHITTYSLELQKKEING